MTEVNHSVDALFDGKEAVVRAIYDRIIEAMARIGPFTEEPSETSIHFVHSVAFAGVEPRENALVLTFRTDRPVDHLRVARSEQVSANRWHVEIMLSEPNEVDDQVREWLADAMELV